MVLVVKGEFDESTLLLGETLAAQTPDRSIEPGQIAKTLHKMATAATQAGNYRAADSLLQHAVKLLDEAGSLRDAQQTIELCLLALHRYEAAEPLLAESYHILEARPEHGCRQQARDGLHGLIELYRARGEPEKVAEYQAMLAAFHS